MTTTAKPALEQLPYSTSQTGLVYDVRMRFHVEVRPEVNQGVHPEDPRRIYAIYKELVDAGLVDDPSTVSLAPSVLARIPTRFVTKQEVCAVHSERHWEFVISLELWDNEDLHNGGSQMDSIYLSKNSPMCARLSAGGAIEACRGILNGHVKNAIAVIRPPGHHAEHDEPMGFCLFNN
ncbi:histone deacetylase HdaA, partial [Aureobasidium pullulans]